MPNKRCVRVAEDETVLQSIALDRGGFEAAGGRAVAIQADVGSESDVARAFIAVDAAFGSLGGLVNNAVLAGPPRRLGGR